jgi:hypothetical protein
MSLDKIIWAIAAIAAIALAFFAAPMEAAIFAVIGLASGYFIKGDHRRAVLIAAIFLGLGGASAFGAIPVIGVYMTAIFTNYAAVLSAAGLMVIIMATAERLIPNMASATPAK